MRNTIATSVIARFCNSSNHIICHAALEEYLYKTAVGTDNDWQAGTTTYTLGDDSVIQVSASDAYEIKAN